MPETSTHAAPARLCTVRRVSSARRAASEGGVTPTMRTSFGLRSRTEKSAFCACAESQRCTPSAMAASSSRKKRKRDTSAGSSDDHEAVEHEILVQHALERKMRSDL